MLRVTNRQGKYVKERKCTRIRIAEEHQMN